MDDWNETQLGRNCEHKDFQPHCELSRFEIFMFAINVLIFCEALQFELVVPQHRTFHMDLNPPTHIFNFYFHF